MSPGQASSSINGIVARQWMVIGTLSPDARRITCTNGWKTTLHYYHGAH